jgi:flagellar motor switch protein FliM
MNPGDAPPTSPLPGPAEAEAGLQAAAPAPASSAADAPPAPSEPAPPPPTWRPYDFRSPSFCTQADLRRLRGRHEEFARSLAVRLSIYLRLEFGNALTSLQPLSARRLIESLPSPSHLILFQIEGRQGVGLIQVPPRFGLALVDRMLGGPGTSAELNRPLTEIEVALLDLAAQILLKEWSQAVWAGADASAQIIGHETNAQFLKNALSEANLLEAVLQVRLDAVTDTLRLAFSQTLIEPLLRQAPVSADLAQPAAPRFVPPLWSPQLEDLAVEVSAGWFDLQLTAQRLASLQVGEVLPIHGALLHQVSVSLAKRPKFIGRLGQRAGARAVEVLGAVPVQPV